MPNVYTRTGDTGLTGLFGGSRVPKLDPGVEAYGTVDEANSAIGEAKALATDASIKATLHGIQQRLFVLAAELASDEAGRAILDNTICAADVKDLEDLIDMCLSVTGPQRNFVVPGRDVPSSALHAARTVVRRAERRVLAMATQRDVRAEVIKYLNRLSDTLFALARLSEHQFDLAHIKQVVRDAVEKVLGAQAEIPGQARDDGGFGHPGEVSRHPGEVSRHPGERRDLDAGDAGAGGQIPGQARDDGVRHAGEPRHPGEPSRHPGERRDLDPAPDRADPAGYDLAVLKRMAEAAEAQARAMGVPIVFAGVDSGGNLMLLHRMADSLLASIDIAINKAFTSAAFKLPTSALKDASAPSGELHGIQNSNAGRVVVFGGGVPVFAEGRIVGGIGVSGGTVDEDVRIVMKAIAAGQKENQR
ncbi:MAG: cob(I)yrinic acid a,c-diamide adenosyltransferase [Micropruina sp.]|nr:cob(I)yrinic acid a,c-diamide adenosyltransferase [Micropruina sp.]